MPGLLLASYRLYGSKMLPELLFAALLASLIFCGSVAAQQSTAPPPTSDDISLQLDETAGVINLPPPFNDYYQLITELGPDFIDNGKIIGALAIALGSQGYDNSAWQLSAQVEPTVARAELRLELATQFISSGNRELAEDALNSAAQILLYEALLKARTEVESAELIERYPHALSKLVTLETSLFGFDATLRRIAAVKDNTTFGLLITIFINSLGDDLVDLDFLDEDSNVPSAVLDIVYNRLASPADRARYIDNLLTLADYFFRQSNAAAADNLRVTELLNEVMQVLAEQEDLLTPDRQRRLVRLLVGSDQLGDATRIVSELSDPYTSGELLLLIAEELMAQGRREQAQQIYRLTLDLIRQRIEAESGNGLLLRMVNSLARFDLLAEAYELIIDNDDPEIREQLALVMAQALYSTNRAEMVDNLWPFITDSNQRSRLFLQAALSSFEAGEREAGLGYLNSIFLENNFKSEDDGYAPEILADLLRITIAYGEISEIQDAFDRALMAVDLSQDQAKRYYLETLILQLHAMRSEKKMREAHSRARDILAHIWPYRNSEYYAATVTGLIQLLAQGGEHNLAITQAIAMWDDPARPETGAAKQLALAYALEHTINSNNFELARRSLSAINNQDDSGSLLAQRALVVMLRALAGQEVESEF